MTDREEIDAISKKVSNWGRWGEQDEAGALNHISPEIIIEASRSVSIGKVVSLQLPIKNGWGPQENQSVSLRANPVHLMSVLGHTTAPDQFGAGVEYSDDYIMMPGQAGSQWDAFSHMWYDKFLYNGIPSDVITTSGASRGDIGGVNDRFVSRGVLLDVAAHKGLDVLEPGYAITIDDLLETEEAQGVTVRTGDILIVRTGVLGACVREGNWDRVNRLPEPGLHFSTAQWIAEREVAAVASDNQMVEAVGVLKEYFIPMHMILLRDMGVHLGEFWWLEDLSNACREHNKYEMMLVAQPLKITGGVGSPVNPMAIL
ncbi:MAG: cyclase family protein [Subtercola sp.]|nr:cyclase family protein [Subtercola sp.]